LPPCIGVVDLVLRKAERFAVIDHKTGKNFGNTDALQMVVYRQYARTKHKAEDCLTFFDEYRWVNDLGRIRKPAFQRTSVRLRSTAWPSALRRFAKGHQRIRRVEREHDARGTGECYMCSFREVCDKAAYTSFSW
jgi:predicted RecB family nuclease